MARGKLIYNFENNRFGIWDGNDWEHPGFHCGEPVEVLINNSWERTRFETDKDGEWYLVGFPDAPINGMAAKI